MCNKGERCNTEEEYLKTNVKELVDESSNFDLLYLIKSLLGEDANKRPLFCTH